MRGNEASDNNEDLCVPRSYSAWGFPLRFDCVEETVKETRSSLTNPTYKTQTLHKNFL